MTGKTSSVPSLARHHPRCSAELTYDVHVLQDLSHRHIDFWSSSHSEDDNLSTILEPSFDTLASDTTSRTIDDSIEVGSVLWQQALDLSLPAIFLVVGSSYSSE